MRRDAASSRRRILEAAKEVFADRGFGVPMAEIAEAAGVGVATLSRHFTRTQLVEAVAQERLTEHVEVLDAALALPSTEGVVSYMRELCQRRIVDRSLCHIFTLRMPDSPEVARLRGVLRLRQAELIDAGNRAGVLRAGVVPEDLLLILEAVQGVMDSTTGDASWERVFAMLMASIDPRGSRSPWPEPPAAYELLENVDGPSRGRRTSLVPGL